MAKHSDPLFDLDRARGPRSGPDVGEDVTERFRSPAPRGPMSVSALVYRIKDALDDAFAEAVTVVGELSNCKLHSSGHFYFRLKDASCAIDAVMWRSGAQKLKFQPADGLEVLATGRVGVYEVRGQLQIYVQSLSPKGAGALELAFRQLKEKLQAEGLFQTDRKKPIPRLPTAVGIITSPTGAAIRDISRTIRRRFPAAGVYLVPALVQGDRAAASIVEALRLLDTSAPRLGVQTIILARGGGSLEDLWPFNEESVARAVFAAKTPIISGVGHESDVTICDLVADIRAATPTGAAELAVPDRRELAQQLAQLLGRLDRRAMEILSTAEAQLEAVRRSGLFRDPTARVRTHVQRVDEQSYRLDGAVRRLLADAGQRLSEPINRLTWYHPARLTDRARAKIERLADGLRWALGSWSKAGGDRLWRLERRLSRAHPANRLRLGRQQVDSARRELEALSHRNVLRRGYSVTRRPSGAIVRSAGELRRGDLIRTELADGKLSSKVTGTEPNEPPSPESQRTLWGHGSTQKNRG